MTSFMNFLKVNKEGALIGGGVGLVLYWYIKQQGINLMSVGANGGLLPAIMGRSSDVAIVDMKVLLTCVLLGVAIGLIMDATIKPNK